MGFAFCEARGLSSNQSFAILRTILLLRWSRIDRVTSPESFEASTSIMALSLHAKRFFPALVSTTREVLIIRFKAFTAPDDFSRGVTLFLR